MNSIHDPLHFITRSDSNSSCFFTYDSKKCAIKRTFFRCKEQIYIVRDWTQGLTFPGARGHMPLDFAQICMKINQKSCFWPLIFIKTPFRAPSLKSTCQTLGHTVCKIIYSKKRSILTGGGETTVMTVHPPDRRIIWKERKNYDNQEVKTTIIILTAAKSNLTILMKSCGQKHCWEKS